MKGAMPDTPLITVIIPTHDRDSVSASVDSVLRQDYGDFEVIVVDDGSSSPVTAERYGWPEGKVRVFRFERGGGPARARNKGIELARGEYVAFLDDDDEYFPEKLGALAAAVSVPEPPEVVYHNCRINYVNERIWYNTRKAAMAEYRSSIFRGNILGGTVNYAASRALLNRLGGFDESMPTDEDYDLAIRMILSGSSVAFIPGYLTNCFYRTKHASVSKQISRRLESLGHMLEKYRSELESSGQRSAFVAGFYADIAHSCINNYDRANACSFYFRSFAAKPGLKSLALVALSLLPARLVLGLRAKA